MKAGLLFLALALGRAAVTPVDRVISLLTKLSAQVQEEGKAEAESYDKYACFCKDQADDKVYVIAKSDKIIQELSAEITALEGEISALDEAVGQLTTDIEGEEKTQKENQEARDKEVEEYTKQRKSLVEAVEAVEGALRAMKTSRDDVAEQLSSLLQKLPAHSAGLKPTLALIAGASAGSRYGTPPGEAKAYSYDSKEVIDTLKTLTMTFKKELATLDEDEITTRSAFEMTAGARANRITALNKDKTEKEDLSAAKTVTKGEKEAVKKDETTDRNADQSFLDVLTSECEGKAKAWDQRSTTRASELTAIVSAVETLKGMGDVYNSNSKLVGLVTKASNAKVAQHAPMLLQLRSVGHLNEKLSAEKLQQKLAKQLSDKAHSLSSAPLAMVALQLETSGPDHFVKIRGIITDLISKLEADAKAEATAKGVCDKNMAAAIEKRDKNAASIETANAQIDTTESAIEQLKVEIAELADQIAKINKMLLEMKELRKDEKEKNDKTISDAGEGATAVKQAIATLKNFYGDSKLLQTGYTPPNSNRKGETVGDLAPKTFSSDEEYKGNIDASTGIIGILEVIFSDFERTVTTVTQQEADSLAAYNELKTDMDKDVSDKEKLKGKKETEVKTKESDLIGFQDDLSTAQKMHEESLEELEKLKTSCVDGDETYAERVARRKEEIEALKQAMQILEDWQA